MAKHGNLEAWFWSNVDIKSIDECWLWKRRIDHRGYGASRTLYDNGYPQKASRAAFQFHYGIDPKGKVVMHSCDVRACCNPHHLSLGSQYDNMQDRKAKGKYPSGYQHQNCKVSPEIVEQIKNASGTQREIAKSFGLVHSTVGYIKRGSKF